MMGSLIVCAEKRTDGRCPAMFTPCKLGTSIKKLRYIQHIMVCKINVPAHPNKIIGYHRGVTYHVHPRLPIGLKINKFTGVITGTPEVSARSRRYSVVARGGPKGQTTGSLQIMVVNPDKMTQIVKKYDICKSCLGKFLS
jgi:hypothetical protein